MHCGVFIAVGDVAVWTTKDPLGEREMQGDLPTMGTRSRRIGRIDEHDFTASVAALLVRCAVNNPQPASRMLLDRW